MKLFFLCFNLHSTPPFIPIMRVRKTFRLTPSPRKSFLSLFRFLHLSHFGPLRQSFTSTPPPLVISIVHHLYFMSYRNKIILFLLTHSDTFFITAHKIFITARSSGTPSHHPSPRSLNTPENPKNHFFKNGPPCFPFLSDDNLPVPNLNSLSQTRSCPVSSDSDFPPKPTTASANPKTDRSVHFFSEGKIQKGLSFFW